MQPIPPSTIETYVITPGKNATKIKNRSPNTIAQAAEYRIDLEADTKANFS
jgi:hypothetical protein